MWRPTGFVIGKAAVYSSILSASTAHLVKLKPAAMAHPWTQQMLKVCMLHDSQHCLQIDQPTCRVSDDPFQSGSITQKQCF